MYDDYNTIENHLWIPKQAFLYFPTGQSHLKQQDDYKLIVKNQIKRLIYEGAIQYVDQQIEKIQQFKSYLIKKQLYLDKRWSKAYLYKFLQSTGYDYKKSMKQIIAHNQYKADLNSKNCDQFRRHAQPYLKQGVFYFNGRDAKYRPIIVCDIAKIHSMKFSDQNLYKTLQYFFQFMYRNMFINGQVQNVVGIIDVGFTSPLDLVKPMKMTIGFLQGNYKYKLHAVYIIQSTNMFQFFYGIAKHLMRQDTIRKICVIEKGSNVAPLLQYTNPSQLQKKFGGTHQNLVKGQFWPPQQFSHDFSHSSIQRNLVTPDEYKKMYEDGLLLQRKIYLDFINDGSDGEYSIPLLNSSRIMEQGQKIESVIHIQKRQRSVFQRAISKIGCYGCFGSRQVEIRRSKRRPKQ